MPHKQMSLEGTCVCFDIKFMLYKQMSSFHVACATCHDLDNFKALKLGCYFLAYLEQ
jgi:hypothetical protein